MKKIDKILIVLFLVIAAIGAGTLKYISSRRYAENFAEIYVKGKLYKKISLKNKKNPKEVLNIKTDLGENVVEIVDGGVRIIDATCHDKICVKDGFKDKVGDVLVCLPHKVIIKIKGYDNKKEYDDISQ